MKTPVNRNYVKMCKAATELQQMKLTTEEQPEYNLYQFEIGDLYSDPRLNPNIIFKIYMTHFEKKILFIIFVSFFYIL